MPKPSWAGNKRDANEAQIVRDLKACGFEVERLSELSDLLIWPKAGGEFGILEIKDPSQPPSKRVLTAAEQDFFDRSQGCRRAVAQTSEQAITFACTLRRSP